MHPLPIVILIIGLFLVSAFSLAGLIAADWLAERRLARPKQDGLNLSFESLMQELSVGV